MATPITDSLNMMLSSLLSTMATSEGNHELMPEYRLLDIYQKADRKVTKQIFQRAIQMSYIENGRPDNPAQGVFNLINAKKRSVIKDGPKSFLVTISFKGNVNPDDVMSAIQKYSKKTCINTISVYHEQRGETIEEMGMGYHIHMVVEFNKLMAKSDVIREAYNPFRGFVDSQSKVDVRVKRDDKVYDYLTGSKKPEKMARVAIDKMFKIKYSVN